MWCPKCKNDRAHRSHRKGLKEHLASLLAYYPYRCRECKHRFLSNHYAAPEPPTGEHRGTEREIRANRRTKDWQRKKRHMAIYGAALLLFLAFLYFVTRDRGANENGNSALRPSTVQNEG